MNRTLKAIPAALLLATTASAFALTAGSGTWVLETATYGTPNLQNAYVYVPANANPAVLGGKRALMLTMHGCGQTAQGNVIGTKFNWETTAEQYGMVVVAPTVPSGTSGTRSTSGCWDWFGSAHTRTTRDAVPLKKLIDAVMARTNLDIDPNQVYVTGLSSGGGETIVAACTFPEIFAGQGINAGPALGSSSSAISSDPTVTVAQVASYCKAANGNAYNSYFATQITSAVYGTSDYLVKPSHNVRNIAGMASVYGMTLGTPVTTTVTGGGTAKVYKDANGKERLSDMAVTGMSHAWPAGGGAGASYVDTTHVNYPAYITPWFFANNLRVTAGTTTTTTAATTTTTAAATTTTAAGTTTTAAATTTTAAATTTTTAAATTTTTTATTTTTTAGACFNTTNYAHVTAGRAYNSAGYAYANGSATKLGLNNTFYSSKLRMTGSNYYVVDSTCP